MSLLFHGIYTAEGVDHLTVDWMSPAAWSAQFRVALFVTWRDTSISRGTCVGRKQMGDSVAAAASPECALLGHGAGFKLPATVTPDAVFPEGVAMTDSTRRGFLAMAGAGAAAVGVAALAPAADASTPSSSKAVTVTGPVVAYIHDVSKGELSVMIGEREVIVHDHDLVNRLARAAS